MENNELEPYKHTLGQKFMSMKICVVTATREKTLKDFQTNTLLGQSLSINTYFNIELLCYNDNKEGLSKCYNDAIGKKIDEDIILVFVHDDIALLDYYWPLRVIESLQKYDIAGVAGNIRHQINFPSWAHSHSDGNQVIWDEDKNLSGCMLHSDSWPPKIVTVYGDLNKEVVNLDGAFLACRTNTLKNYNLRFDEQFEFHFYDADFCKNAHEKHCKLGTFPLALMHAGKGRMDTNEYRSGYLKYYEKWSKI